MSGFSNLVDFDTVGKPETSRIIPESFKVIRPPRQRYGQEQVQRIVVIMIKENEVILAGV